MGLDVTFYRCSKSDPSIKDEIGYFRKVDFILRYFMISHDDNNRDIIICKELFEQFDKDLTEEIGSHEFTFDEIHSLPNNLDLAPYEYFFNGIGICDSWYWQDLCCVGMFVYNTLENFNWDSDFLILNCDW